MRALATRENNDLGVFALINSNKNRHLFVFIGIISFI